MYRNGILFECFLKVCHNVSGDLFEQYNNKTNKNNVFLKFVLVSSCEMLTQLFAQFSSSESKIKPILVVNSTNILQREMRINLRKSLLSFVLLLYYSNKSQETSQLTFSTQKQNLRFWNFALFSPQIDIICQFQVHFQLDGYLRVHSLRSGKIYPHFTTEW